MADENIVLKLGKMGKGGKQGFRRLLLIVLAAVAIFLFSFSSLFSYVHPNQFGIKEVRIGPDKGIRHKVIEPGFALIIKPFGIQRLHLYPRDVQVFELTAFAQGPRGRDYGIFRDKAAHIQTSDGFYVDVDVTILYRITDPYLVLTKVGQGALYITNGIVPKAEPALKEALGELTTEEFYNSPLRYEKALVAKEILNTELNSKGIEVEHLLIRYFQYSDEIQRNIEEKKLKDQMVFKNQAEKRAAAESAKLRKVIEEGKANVQIKLEEGKAYVTRKRAEKNLYLRRKTAEANLLVELAEAKRTELKNTALQAGGSDRLVGLRMAEVLNGVELIMLPSDGEHGVNPLDLGNLLKLFDVRSGRRSP